MKAHEIEEAIGDGLSPEGLAYWNGMESHNEMVIEAQRNGIDAAIVIVGDLAKPEGETMKCHWCRKEFDPAARQLPPPESHYCSPDCLMQTIRRTLESIGIRHEPVESSHRVPGPLGGENANATHYYYTCDEEPQEVSLYAAWGGTSGHAYVRGLADIPRAIAHATQALGQCVRTDDRTQDAQADVEQS